LPDAYARRYIQVIPPPDMALTSDAYQ